MRPLPLVVVADPLVGVLPQISLGAEARIVKVAIRLTRGGREAVSVAGMRSVSSIASRRVAAKLVPGQAALKR
jgi:hypothetical protein